MFKGQHVESFKSMWEDLGEAKRWSEEEKKLQLKAHVEDWIRPMFRHLGRETSAAEMMQMLVMRFGVNMTSAEVQNALLKIERKPNEDLYSLADRVRNMVARADFSLQKKKSLERHHFFTALRTNTELQHWVARYDNEEDPDIQLTLQLAVHWERQHGTQQKSDKVRNINTESDSSIQQSSTETDATDTTVNNVKFIKIRDLQSEEAKTIARAHNQMVQALRKNSRNILDEDDATSNKSSSSGWKKNSSYDSSKSGKYNNRSRSKTRRSPNKTKNRSKSRDKQRDKKKYNKGDKRDRRDRKKKDTRANKVEDEDTSEATERERSTSRSPSKSASGSGSESESNSE